MPQAPIPMLYDPSLRMIRRLPQFVDPTTAMDQPPTARSLDMGSLFRVSSVYQLPTESLHKSLQHMDRRDRPLVMAKSALRIGSVLYLATKDPAV